MNTEQSVGENMANADAAPVTTGPKKLVPSEYIAMPSNTVRPTEYIAMPSNMPAATVDAPVAAHNLTQIETNPDKAAKIAHSTPGHAQSHAPRRRERTREVYVENEPLEQVETQHPAA
jgi:hypothetical protein